MKTIQLTQGKEALVDDEDYLKYSKLRWSFSHGYSNNTSGHTGLWWWEARKKWMVRVGGKTVGYFDTVDEAVKARKQKLMDDFGVRLG